jgi:hypothetical protein
MPVQVTGIEIEVFNKRHWLGLNQSQIRLPEF